MLLLTKRILLLSPAHPPSEFRKTSRKASRSASRRRVGATLNTTSILWTTRIYSCLSVSICHLWSVSYSSLGMEICQMVVQWFSQIVLLWSIEKWWDFCHRIRKARRVGHGGFGDANQRAWLVLRLIIIGPRIGQGWQTADYKQMVGIFVDLRNLT
jgi:hypothetical protein